MDLKDYPNTGGLPGKASNYIMEAQQELTAKRDALATAKISHMRTKLDATSIQVLAIEYGNGEGLLDGKNAEQRKDNRDLFETTDKKFVEATNAITEATARLIDAERDYHNAKDLFSALRETTRLQFNMGTDTLSLSQTF